MVKILLVLVLLVAMFLSGLRVNLTNSMPIGFYYKVNKAPEVGDTVAVCLSESIAAEGLAKGYLLPGHCPSKMMPLLKSLLAGPHDNVVVTEQIMRVNGQSYLAPQHIGVKHFYPQKSSGYWLYGKNNPNTSWDSRYFGAVQRRAIMGVYRPVWVKKTLRD